MKLIKASEVAEMLRVQKSYFLSFIQTSPQFPRSIRFPNGRGGMTQARWDEADIINYINQQKKAA